MVLYYLKNYSLLFSSLLEEEGIITIVIAGNMPDIIKNYLKETISQSIQLLHVHDINGIEFEKLSSQESFLTCLSFYVILFFTTR